MTRLLTLPIKISLRIFALELRIARDVAGAALDITRDLAGGSPLDREAVAPEAPPVPRPAATDPVEPARQARRGAAVQRTRAQRRPPAATTATDIPPAPEEAPRPRPRRAARKATAAKPGRTRKTGPTRGEAAAIREAQRETEAAAPAGTAGPATGAGPEIRVEAPWEGYDAMALDEVLARLEGADAATVAAVRLYEGQHESRQAILLATETP